MSPDTLQALRSRIHRTQLAVHQSAASGHEQTHTLEDGTTHQYNFNGMKSPEQLQDELLALFVWVWSLKDYLKEVYKAKNCDPRLVEEVVNQCLALQYVADVANRAKHGVLRESRSGKFAELVDVGFTIPQKAISKISVRAFSVGVDVAKPEEVNLHAFIKTNGAKPIDAFATLTEAMNAWEAHVIKRIATIPSTT
jgi:hypothetical protein